MRIHLIRHGQTNWNKERRVQGQSESTLTAEGREQAAALRTQLAAFGIGRVYCSSSVRTRETAEVLFEGTPAGIEYCDALREIFLGPWEGSLYADMELKHPENFAAFWHRPHAFALEGAETFLQTQQRGILEFQRIMQENAAQEVAIVSHGVMIKAILCHLEKRPLERLWEPPQMHNCAHSIVETDGPDGGLQKVRIVQYAGIRYPQSMQQDSAAPGLLDADPLVTEPAE